MKKLFYLFLLIGFSVSAQYTPSTNVNYVKFMKIPPVGSVNDSVLTIGSDGFMKRVLRSDLRQDLDQTLTIGNTTDLPAIFTEGTYTTTVDPYGMTVVNSSGGQTGTFNENTLQFADPSGKYFGLDGVNRQIQWVNPGTGQSVEIKADSVATGYTSQMPKLASSATPYFPGYLLKVNATDSIPANSFGTIDMTHNPLVLTDGTNTIGFYIDQVILTNADNTNTLDPGGVTISNNTNPDVLNFGVSDTDAQFQIDGGSSDERIQVKKDAIIFRNEISSTNGSQTVEPFAAITGNQRFFLPNLGTGSYTLATTADAYTDEMAQDAVGGIFDSTLIYNDGTPSMGRAAITGDISVPAGSNTAAISAGVIVNADINASAAIDATKLVDGSVSNAELEYINSLTSNAQTQIDTKQANIQGASGILSIGTANQLIRVNAAGTALEYYTPAYPKKTSTYSPAVTGTTAETILYSIPISGGDFASGNLMYINAAFSKTGTAGTTTIRFKVNTSNSLSGATQLSTFTTGATSLSFNMERTLSFQASNVLDFYPATQAAVSDKATPSVLGRSTTTLDPSSTWYFIISAQNSTVGDSSSAANYFIERK